MALLDTIRNNLAQQASPTQAPGIVDNTAQVGALQQAKTGKVGGSPSGARATNLQEQIASGQAALGLAEVQQQAKLQSQQLAQTEKAQTEQQGLAERQLDEAKLQQHDTFANQSARILQDFSQQGRTLDFKKDAAKIEQLGIASRLANDKYVFQLEQEGSRSRLDTEIGFDEALQNAIWDDEKELLDSDLEFRQVLNGKTNEWNEYMSAMGLDQALSAAEVQRKAESQRMVWAGGTEAASAGIGYAAGADERERQAAKDKREDAEMAGRAPSSGQSKWEAGR